MYNHKVGTLCVGKPCWELVCPVDVSVCVCCVVDVVDVVVWMPECDVWAHSTAQGREGLVHRSAFFLFTVLSRPRVAPSRVARRGRRAAADTPTRNTQHAPVMMISTFPLYTL